MGFALSTRQTSIELVLLLLLPLLWRDGIIPKDIDTDLFFFLSFGSRRGRLAKIVRDHNGVSSLSAPLES